LNSFPAKIERPGLYFGTRGQITRAVTFTLVLLFLASTDAFPIKRPSGRNSAENPYPPQAETPLNDPYEPNESRESAAELSWSQVGLEGWSEVVTDQAVVENFLDFDFYRLELSQGDSLVAEFQDIGSSPEGFEPLLSLLDSSGVVIASAGGAEPLVSATSGYHGVFYLLVNHSAILDPAGSASQEGHSYILRARRFQRRGDMDGNGLLDYRDAFLVFVLASGLRDSLAFSAAQRRAADFDGDGTVVGDLDDFRLALRAVSCIPGRDPSLPDKTKANTTGPSLASVGISAWRLDFTDGSAVELSWGRAPELASAGNQAQALLEVFSKVFSRLSAGGISNVRLPAAGLAPNVPNPFNPSTAITFRLPASGRASLEVFDLRCRRVKILFQGRAGQGSHTVYWDGTDSEGRRLASGVYFYRLKAGEESITRKMILVK
jgi:hypothetical protein